jgi:hypothetical protein
MLKFRADIGSCKIKPSGTVISASENSWDIIYTAGKSGIEKGGKISFGIPHGFSIPQTDNPYMHGYCTAECSRKGISLILRCTRSTSNTIDWQKGIYGSINTGVLVHICEGKMSPGDKITFHYGSKAQGGPGSISRTMEGAAVFTILVCNKDSQSDKSHFYFLKNPPVLQVISRKPEKIYIMVPSLVKAGEKFNAHITAKDEFENTSLRNNIKLNIAGSGALKNTEKTFSLVRKAAEVKITGETAGCGRLKIKNSRPGNLMLETNPLIVKDGQEKHNIYWGDLHCHSFASDGLNEPAYLYEYARDIDRADFTAITDHGYMTDEGWQKCIDAAEKYNKKHSFVTFLAFEHSTPPGIHRNVYYKGSDNKLIRATNEEKIVLAEAMAYKNGFRYKSKYPVVDINAKELFKMLNPKNALVIPHIHQMDWEKHNPEFEPVVEIYSNWGNREYSACKYASVAGTRAIDTVQYALGLGYKLGFVGGGDGHGGRPGKDYWLRVRGARPGGITAIYAEQLTRESLWEALKARHCYATTGKRIIVKFKLNGHMMGDEITLEDSSSDRRLEIEIYGTCSLSKVTIVKNNTDMAVKKPAGDEIKFSLSDKAKAKQGDYYYLRVEQSDGAMAWSSPIWIKIK